MIKKKAASRIRLRHLLALEMCGVMLTQSAALGYVIIGLYLSASRR